MVKKDSFPERLKYLRKARMLTQAALAEQISVTQQAVGLWESGKSVPHGDALRKLALVFSIPLDDLLGIDKSEVSELRERVEKLERQIQELTSRTE